MCVSPFAAAWAGIHENILSSSSGGSHCSCGPAHWLASALPSAGSTHSAAVGPSTDSFASSLCRSSSSTAAHLVSTCSRMQSAMARGHSCLV